MNGIDDFARHKLGQLDAERLMRTLRTVAPGEGPLNFCSNDYLGLSQDPRVKQAAADAAAKYGAGAGASRLVTGNHPLYGTLERKIAALKGTEAAVVFGSGYLANVGTIPVFASEGDLVLTDELAHACMMTGAKLSGAQVIVFRHNDMAHLSARLKEHRATARHCLILTEGVFSMDGDLAPLPEIVRLAHAHDAWVMTDDAHGLGVIGGGRGAAAHWGVRPDIQMGTLSKSAGAYGGFVASSKPVIDLLINRARSLIYATGLPPAVIAAATAGIDIIAEDKALCARPLAHARAFCATLNLPAPESPIVPIILGGAEAALAASAALERQGFLVTAIRPPTVPQGTARLRVTFTAAHSEVDVAGLAEAMRPLIR